MLRAGRFLSTAGLTFFVFISIIQISTTDYGIPIEIKLWESQRNPLNHMVDVTNEFGLKVLAEHNFLNDNNIAFSPYGLVGILVALYEGVDGESSYQIQRSMQLPWNRNVMRIGFRDIHRTLKTYFVPEEGFLAGLALNNENVTFNESYKKILRFYGFDLDKTITNDTEINTTTTAPSGTESTNKTTIREEVTTPPTTETKEETTLNPNAETIDIRESMPETTSMSSTATESEPQSISVTMTNTVEETVQTTTSSSTIEIVSESETTTITMTTTPEPSTQTSTDSSTITPETVTTETAITEMGNSMSDMTTETMNANIEVLTTTTTETSLMSDSDQTDELTLSTDDATITSTTPPSTTLETLQRRKKSIVDFIYTNPPYIDDHFLFRSFDVGIELPDDYNDENKMFLVNGLRNIQVSYMHYDSILDHAYLPHLEASALRLPLDSDRYYLLVVLPLRRGEGEIARLLARMARESDLSDVYAALRPRRVKAVVPSFTVKGHITLTTDLQKLGMRDVFEPRQTDFAPMTHLPGVYVRSIEQAVSVVIRKYQPDNLKNRYISNRNPVVFSATYPFLYFVMDSTINVALMAGKMVDPLNTRIL